MVLGLLSQPTSKATGKHTSVCIPSQSSSCTPPASSSLLCIRSVSHLFPLAKPPSTRSLPPCIPLLSAAPLPLPSTLLLLHLPNCPRADTSKQGSVGVARKSYSRRRTAFPMTTVVQQEEVMSIAGWFLFLYILVNCKMLCSYFTPLPQELSLVLAHSILPPSQNPLNTLLT